MFVLVLVAAVVIFRKKYWGTPRPTSALINPCPGSAETCEWTPKRAATKTTMVAASMVVLYSRA